MQLDISDVLREAGKILPYELTEPPLVDEDVECTSTIDGKITFCNTGGTLLVNGNASTTVALPCSRCNQYFERPVAFAIEEIFELSHTSVGHRSLQTIAIIEEDESPIAGKLFEGNVFNLTEMLRQYILLEEPTRPLPPTNEDGRCSHCVRTPEEVLQGYLNTDEVAEMPKVSAFSKLNELSSRETDDPVL